MSSALVCEVAWLSAFVTFEIGVPGSLRVSASARGLRGAWSAKVGPGRNLSRSLGDKVGVGGWSKETVFVKESCGSCGSLSGLVGLDVLGNFCSLGHGVVEGLGFA